MLLWIMNLGFAGGGVAAAAKAKRGAPVWLHHGGRHTAKKTSGRAKKSGK